VYAVPPKELPAIAECRFYHVIELPGLGVQPGAWDLRPGIDHYLGALDYSGKRVLEVGTASGFVCFELERRGADVVALDLPEDLYYDALPISGTYPAAGVYLEELRCTRNAYWLAHRLLGSKARVVYAHANRLPEQIGHFDVAVIANVLQHLRDPVGAIMQVAQAADAVVVTEADWMTGHYDDAPALLMFEEGDKPFSWYQTKPKLIEVVLQKMGFGSFERSFHQQLFVADDVHRLNEAPSARATGGVLVPHFTVTARRA
jgi:SAM-dependent methyltransferase